MIAQVLADVQMLARLVQHRPAEQSGASTLSRLIVSSNSGFRQVRSH